MARTRPKRARCYADYRWNKSRFIWSPQTNLGAAITDRYFSCAISIQNPPEDGFAATNLRLWIGITTPGAINIRNSIWLKWRERESQKFSMFRCFIRA